MTEDYEAIIEKQGEMIQIDIRRMLTGGAQSEFVFFIEHDTAQELSQRLLSFTENRKVNANTSTEGAVLTGLAQLKVEASMHACYLRIENADQNYIEINLIDTVNDVVNLEMMMHRVEAAKLSVRLQRIKWGEAKQEIVEGIYLGGKSR